MESLCRGRGGAEWSPADRLPVRTRVRPAPSFPTFFAAFLTCLRPFASGRLPDAINAVKRYKKQCFFVNLECTYLRVFLAVRFFRRLSAKNRFFVKKAPLLHYVSHETRFLGGAKISSIPDPHFCPTSRTKLEIGPIYPEISTIFATPLA